MIWIVDATHHGSKKEARFISTSPPWGTCFAESTGSPVGKGRISYSNMFCFLSPVHGDSSSSDCVCSKPATTFPKKLVKRLFHIRFNGGDVIACMPGDMKIDS